MPEARIRGPSASLWAPLRRRPPGGGRRIAGVVAGRDGGRRSGRGADHRARGRAAGAELRPNAGGRRATARTSRPRHDYERQTRSRPPMMQRGPDRAVIRSRLDAIEAMVSAAQRRARRSALTSAKMSGVRRPRQARGPAQPVQSTDALRQPDLVGSARRAGPAGSFPGDHAADALPGDAGAAEPADPGADAGRSEGCAGSRASVPASR